MIDECMFDRSVWPPCGAPYVALPGCRSMVRARCAAEPSYGAVLWGGPVGRHMWPSQSWRMLQDVEPRPKRPGQHWTLLLAPSCFTIAFLLDCMVLHLNTMAEREATAQLLQLSPPGRGGWLRGPRRRRRVPCCMEPLL